MGFWHGLYDLDTYNAMKENNCTYEWAGLGLDNSSDTCNALMDTFNNLVSNINIYDVYGICY